jgi:CRISPR system Cascade subunit CasE
MSLFLSRLAIARRPEVDAIRRLIDPIEGPYREKLHDPEKGRIMDAHHRLIWALFGDRPDRQRDFLWRSEGKGCFLVLSHRPPAADGAGLFDPPEIKDFAPDLRPGDRLAFVLRVNATQTRKTGRLRKSGKPHTHHIDIVMDRLFPVAGQTDLPEGEISRRPALRHEMATVAAREWLARQGERNGFMLEQRLDGEHGAIPDLEVSDYSVVPLPAHVGPREGQPQFGVMDLGGHLRITDPAAFLGRIGEGFGRARAFGCGLMLIRRA